MKNVVVFTDLDGTLLDHETYSVRGAVSALDLLSRRQVKVIPVSSKTSPEIERWMGLLMLKGPYIYENGGGIRIPDGYFKVMPAGERTAAGCLEIGLGQGLATVREGLVRIAQELGFEYRSYSEMSAREITQHTGLKGEELELSRRRAYDEAFIVTTGHDPGEIGLSAARKGLTFTRGGRFYHLTGGCDKGKAVKVLIELYKEEFGDILTVGIGDSYNDLPMLQAVDRPYIVRKPGGGYDPGITEDMARRAEGIGPAGWRVAVEEVMAGVR